MSLLHRIAEVFSSLEPSIRTLLTLCTFALVGLVSLRRLRGSTISQVDVPVVGVGSGLFAELIAAFKSFSDAHKWLEEGYKTYRKSMFKIRMLNGYTLVVVGDELIEEIRKAPDEILSSREAIAQVLQADWTLGDGWREEVETQATLIRSRLTRNLPVLFPSVIDEVDNAFRDELAITDAEWHIISPLGLASNVVCRTSNRIFVGLPLCRDPEYIDLNVRFTMQVAISSALLKQTPKFLKPFVGRFLIPLRKSHKQATRLMADYVEERKRQLAVHGAAWEDKPNDMLQWMIEDLDDHGRQTPNIIARLLHLNFGANHTTIQAFMFALFHVAAEPEKYQEPMRQEMLEMLTNHGWTKQGVEELRLLESFLHESQRFHGVGNASITRRAMQDYQFSNGVFVPKGTMMVTPTHQIHLDEGNYENGREFQGFRFANSTIESEQAPRMVSISSKFVPFGYGKHACPGRFWAVNELKVMMTYLLVHYDVRMENEGVVPPEQWFAHNCLANSSARIKLRQRSTIVF